MVGLELKKIETMTNEQAIELASELAHDRTFQEQLEWKIGNTINDENDMFETHEDGTRHYTEEIQDRFNEWYDYYLTKIESVALD